MIEMEAIKNVREGSGSTVLFNMSGNNIRQGNGSTVLYNTTSRCNVEQLAAIRFPLDVV